MKNLIEIPCDVAVDVVSFVLKSAPKPIEEIAVVATLGFFAGITGRHYNINRSGLNHYFCILAETGVGKEGGVGGIKRLCKYIDSRHEDVRIKRFIGSGRFMSGQALLRALQEKKSFVSFVGEIGILIGQLNDPNGNQLLLKSLLLDIYGKSGRDEELDSSEYADRSKKIEEITSPAVSLVGDSVPDGFYENLELQNIEDGFIPRLTIVHYSGNRPPTNHNRDASLEEETVKKLVSLYNNVVETELTSKRTDVIVDNAANSLILEYENQCDERVNSSTNQGTRSIWTRAALRAAKIAATLAVVNSPLRPILNKQMLQWAISFIDWSTKQTEARFIEGAHGIGDLKRKNDLMNFVKRWKKMLPEERIQKLQTSKKYANSPNIIPIAQLRRGVGNKASFNKRSGGAYRALDSLLISLRQEGLVTMNHGKVITFTFNDLLNESLNEGGKNE